MIQSFKCKETEKIFDLEHSKKFPAALQQLFLRKLRMLNRSISLNDLRIPPANRLEKLKGDRSGRYSIRINEKWRVCFKWQDSNAYEVEIVDYH